jgi:hypothetical protein
LHIPKLLDADDIEKGVIDERCVMTYVSMIAQAYATAGVVPKENNVCFYFINDFFEHTLQIFTYDFGEIF